MLKIHQKHSLRNNHTFRTDIASDLFAEPASAEDLVFALTHTRDKGLKRILIGEGSNLLFTGTFKGLVIHPVLTGIECVDESGSEILVKAGAGVNWDAFVASCVKNNWFGAENLSLIPGSVGAAPVQNIGAYGVEVKDIIDYVEVLDTNAMTLSMLPNHACEFGYRDSVFKHGDADRYIVTAVVFRLKKRYEPVLDYGNLKSDYFKNPQQDAYALRETVIKIRQAKLPDPLETGNAGSFFKNPVVDLARFQQIEASWKNVPHYPAGNDQVKIPAAWLIEHAGWKGKREGDVGTWPHQPLVIVNYGNASGQEVFDFSEKIRYDIKEKFGIILEREVTLVI